MIEGIPAEECHHLCRSVTELSLFSDPMIEIYMRREENISIFVVFLDTF